MDRGLTEYLKFCHRFGYTSFPATEQIILDFITYCKVINYENYARTWVAAVSLKHQELRMINPTSSYLVKQSLKELDKIISENKDIERGA